jgi:divalent metal cation (Fe/Co/Zn/Cd) transporter
VQDSKDPTIFTVLFEDTAALTGLIIALVGVVASQAFNLPMIDGAASVAIGVVLAITAGFLAYESQSLLTGEAADPATRRGIAALAEAEPGVVGLNDLRTMHFGPTEILVALSLDFQDHLSAADVENTVARLEHRIRAAYPQAGRIYVEAQSLASHAAVRQAVMAGGGPGALVAEVPGATTSPPAPA